MKRLNGKLTKLATLTLLTQFLTRKILLNSIYSRTLMVFWYLFPQFIIFPLLCLLPFFFLLLFISARPARGDRDEPEHRLTSQFSFHQRLCRRLFISSRDIHFSFSVILSTSVPAGRRVGTERKHNWANWGTFHLSCFKRLSSTIFLSLYSIRLAVAASLSGAAALAASRKSKVLRKYEFSKGRKDEKSTASRQ